MAPAALGEAPSAVNANGPDGVVVEETHPKDLVAGESALPDEPDKENVFGRLACIAAFPGCLRVPTSESDCAGMRTLDFGRSTIPIFASRLREGLTCSSRSTIPDDLFDDDSDEDDVNEFVPRGKGAKPTEAQAAPKPARPVRKPTDATSQAAAGKELGAAATTEKPKDAKAQKKGSKVTK